MTAQVRAPLGYYWGDDGYGVEHGPDELAARLALDGVAPERWRVAGNATTADQITERVATAPLFGGGTLAVVSEPTPLMSSKAAAGRLLATLAAVAPGNGLAFLETVDRTQRRAPSTLEPLRAAIREAGGDVREFKAPTQNEMSQWIGIRARERGIRIEPQAAELLARRVGAFVREGDVDRRRQGQLAVAELEKLALFRLDQEIRRDDVAALVAEAIPGSAWAFLDAVGSRHAGDAGELAERMLDQLPGPVIVVQLHRRLRELLDIRELLAGGAPVASLVRTLKLNPYRAQRLAEQARAWTSDELVDALEGLLELDSTIKGIDGGGEARRRVGLDLWIAERVRRAVAG